MLLRLYPFIIIIVWDCEAILIPNTDVPATSRTTFTMRHELVSISVASNVPGFEEAFCLLRDLTTSTRDLVNRFIDYIIKISAAANLIMLERYEVYRDLITDEKLAEQFDVFMSQIPVIGNVPPTVHTTPHKYNMIQLVHI